MINGADYHQIMKKSLGSKRKYITEDQIKELSAIYCNFKEGDHCKIFPNEYFGYTKVTIEQPLVDADGKPITDKQSKPKPDGSMRDFERIPLSENVDSYYKREVKPHLPNSWMDRDKDKIGYEINFTKYFYQYKPLRSLEEITKELWTLEDKSEGLMKKLLN